MDFYFLFYVIATVFFSIRTDGDRSGSNNQIFPDLKRSTCSIFHLSDPLGAWIPPLNQHSSPRLKVSQYFYFGVFIFCLFLLTLGREIYLSIQIAPWKSPILDLHEYTTTITVRKLHLWPSMSRLAGTVPPKSWWGGPSIPQLSICGLLGAFLLSWSDALQYFLV